MRLFSVTNVILKFLYSVHLVLSSNDLRTIEVISNLLMDSKCAGLVVVSDAIQTEATEHSYGDEGLVNSFISHQSEPLIHLESVNGSVLAFTERMKWKKERVCHNVVIFGRQQSVKLSSIYREIKTHFFVNKAAIVTQFSREEATDILFDIQDEKVFILLEKLGRDLERFSWTANNITSFTVIGHHSNTSLRTALGRSVNLSGRHFLIATVDFPPAVIIDNNGGIKGIEPSIIEALAHSLKFTYSYVQTSPNEMWGEIFGTEGNHTFTGLLGMVARKEVEISSGGLYISSIRSAFIDYTNIYNIAYETFVIRAPQPYGKWTALFYSFTWPTWLATIASAFVVIVMLRFVAACTSRYSENLTNDVFADFQYCCLYVIGNLSNVQVQPQNIISGPNRIFLIGWLFATLILSTGYRSGLISYMTFPFMPPTIDTLQQLVDSPLQKVVYGGYFKSILMNSTNELEKKIGEELIPQYNLTGMFVSLESGSIAVQSNLNNILYMAATMYPTTKAGPQVHLIKENIVPAWTAFGLQKNSQLKPYFDKEIQRLIESGLIEHHRTTFAKKLDKWNPKKANDRISFSLDNLQGAFYLLGVGIVASILVFIVEVGLTSEVFKARPQE